MLRNETDRQSINPVLKFFCEGAMMSKNDCNILYIKCDIPVKRNNNKLIIIYDRHSRKANNYDFGQN